LVSDADLSGLGRKCIVFSASCQKSDCSFNADVV